MGILQTGNTFDTQTFKQGHTRKVWRETRRQWPVGGRVTNVSDWVEKGKIPTGTPCKYNNAVGAKEIICYTDAQVKAAADDIDALGINGYTDRDIPILNGQTVGTTTVIREGDIYEYMFDEDVAAILIENTKCPGVTFVN
ncbi:MAG: hypothetical protein K2M69_01735 [Muribaculaceae bacterium]|nr:hypothetical protein [Muribaculaceae bacterium]